ncbi:hypothetical protein FC48_GL001801 [Ligilactobacillus murinus DSM 20452 = NBRC 14221]|uniref:Uncharacterized protein n=2 Tax=Ligilactobacillus murinus TaxID=1622 RepID=A0A0R2AV45_9LACO|nr:hypothetical protein FC48_GL001801 [Ligilactobacillus murinus DSM 20452 = NBRC 14221]
MVMELLKDFYTETTEELRKASAIEVILCLPVVKAVKIVYDLEKSERIDKNKRFSLRGARLKYLNEIEEFPKFEGDIDHKEFRDFIFDECLFERLYNIDQDLLESVITSLA